MYTILLTLLLFVILPFAAVHFDCLPEPFPDYAEPSCLPSPAATDPPDQDGVHEYFDNKNDKGEEEETETKQRVQHQRKPWDPPIPKTEGGYSFGIRIPPRSDVAPEIPPPPEQQISPLNIKIPSASPVQSRRKSPKSALGQPAFDHPQPPSNTHPNAQSQISRSPTHKSKPLSIVETACISVVFILSLLAFAILTAHCLAWFIVYKTEARLGEVRKGLLRGGDMRVCLCAH